MAQSQHLSSAVLPAPLERPACPKCYAAMMLVSIEPDPARDVDLHTFKCAVCDQVFETLAAYEDPMKSKALGCKSAQGLDADRRAMSLINQAMEGSTLQAYLHHVLGRRAA